MLITLYIYLLNPKVAKNLELRFSPKARLSKSVEFDSFQKYKSLTINSTLLDLIQDKWIIILFVFIFQMESARKEKGERGGGGGDWDGSLHYPEHWLVSLM